MNSKAQEVEIKEPSQKRKIEKRPLSPVPEPDSPLRKKEKEATPEKKNPPATGSVHSNGGGADKSSQMTLIGAERYISPNEFQVNHAC